MPSAWVKCELHTFKRSPKFVKMEFIELDAAGKQVAKANGGCFPSEWERIEAAFDRAGLRLEEGSQVLVRLEASVNAAYGFNVSVLDIDVNFALGDLNTRIQAIRKSLQDAGFWGLNRGLSKPSDFVRVAVISPTGAAGLGDFRSTADRLMAAGLVHFDYHEAPFQTRDAPARIVEILRRLYKDGQHPDTRHCAIAIIRGGGASADLAWLIDQKLTEAVCRMNVPVMTGIGHERDKNLLDEVSCIACDTPSKVAEHISRTVVQAASAGHRAYEIIHSHTAQALDRLHAGMTEARHSIDRDAKETVRFADVAVRGAAAGLEPHARERLEDAQRQVADTFEAVRNRARHRREDAADTVGRLREDIRASADAGLTDLQLGCGRARSEIVARAEGVPSAAADDLRRMRQDILEDARDALAQVRNDIMDMRDDMADDARRTLDAGSHAIAMMQERAGALDPRTVLAAGYAILRDGRGSPLTSAASVATAGSVQADMRDGSIELATTSKHTGGSDQ